MVSAFIVALILAIGWNVTVFAVAAHNGIGLFREQDATDSDMDCQYRSVEAEVDASSLDVQPDAWRRSANATECLPSRMERTAQTVEQEVPYAEAAVTVTANGKEQKRRCSVCMN